MFAPSQSFDRNVLVLCRKLLLPMNMTDMNTSVGLHVGLLQKTLMDSQSDTLAT